MPGNRTGLRFLALLVLKFLSKCSVSCGGFMPPYICGMFINFVVNFLAVLDGFQTIARFSLNLAMAVRPVLEGRRGADPRLLPA